MRSVVNTPPDLDALRAAVERSGDKKQVTYRFYPPMEAADTTWSANSRSVTPTSVSLRGLWSEGKVESVPMAGGRTDIDAMFWVEDVSGQVFSTRDKLETAEGNIYRVVSVVHSPGATSTTLLGVSLSK